MASENDEWLFVELAGAAVAGFLSAFGIASTLLMPPADMLRWVQNGDLQTERIARALSPAETVTQWKSKMIEAQASAAQCQAELIPVKKRADELEFQLTAAGIGKVGSLKGVQDICVRDVETLRAIRVKAGEASRQLGGRLYIGVESTFNSHCDANFSSDIENIKDISFMKLGAYNLVKTSIGTFKVVLTKVAGNKIDKPIEQLCEFDVLRQ